MEEVLKYLKYFPDALWDFIRFIPHPIRFLESKADNSREAFHRALVFSSLLTLIGLLLSSVTSEENLSILALQTVILTVIQIVLLSASVRLSFVLVRAGGALATRLFVTNSYLIPMFNLIDDFARTINCTILSFMYRISSRRLAK